MTDMYGPLGYLGVKAPRPPNLIKAQRPPINTDWKYDVGTVWIDQAGHAAYELVSIYARVANWQTFTSTGFVTSLTDQGGVQALPAAGIIQIAAGNNITTAAAGNAVTVAFNTGSNLTVRNLTASGDLTAKSIASKNSLIPDFDSNPILQSKATTGAAPTGVTGDTNIVALQNNVTMEQFILGAGQTIIAPRLQPGGLSVGLDLVATEGAEYNFGVLPMSKHAYLVGTAAPFYFELSFTVADVTGADPILMGFRAIQVNNAALAAYTDFAAIGLDNAVNPGTIIVESQLASGGIVTTDTTNAWVDGETHYIGIYVDAVGNVTYLIDGVAPTVQPVFAFAAGTIVVPFFRLTQGAALPTVIYWTSMAAGVQ